MILLPASDFTLEELTEAYNWTRKDYLIPMPMNPGRLQEYLVLYDVNLPYSRVAVIGESIVGLGMLGTRGDSGWITRLGVLPDGRRNGVGGAVLQALLDEAAANQMPVVWLEVVRQPPGPHPLPEGRLPGHARVDRRPAATPLRAQHRHHVDNPPKFNTCNMMRWSNCIAAAPSE